MLVCLEILGMKCVLIRKGFGFVNVLKSDCFLVF